MLTQNTLKTKDHNKCPECKGSLIQHNHEQVCNECGLIIDELVLVSSYKIYNTKNTDSGTADQYCSIGKTHDNVCTLGSHIDHYNSSFFHDHNHRLISSNQQKLFRKLKKYYSLPLKIKNHETDYRILKILNKITNYLKLSSQLKNRAAYFYQRIKRNAKYIRNHISLIGYCIFFASREYSYNAPIGIREICNVFTIMGHRISPKLILRDSLEYQSIIKDKNVPHKSEDYISRFVNSIVNLPEIIERMEKKKSKWTIEEYRMNLTKFCEFILKKLTPSIRGSRNPYILAGAIVYCSDKLVARKFGTKSILTQKNASVAMKIPEYSIRDHFVKILKPYFNI